MLQNYSTCNYMEYWHFSNIKIIHIIVSLSKYILIVYSFLSEVEKANENVRIFCEQKSRKL